MVLAYSVKRSFIFHFYSSTCVFSTADIKAHTEQYYSFGSILFHTDKYKVKLWYTYTHWEMSSMITHNNWPLSWKTLGNANNAHLRFYTH